MTSRTDRSVSHRELSREFVATLGFAAMVVLVYSLWHTTRETHPYGISPDVTLPAILVSGWTMQQELEVFRGGTSLPMSPQYFSLLGLSLLLFFVVGPVFLAVSIRRAILKQAGPLPDFLTLAGILFGLYWMTTAGAFVAFQGAKTDRLTANYRIQRMSDRVINHLSEISIDAAVFAAVPESKGGGGGSLRNYRLPTRLWKPQIADFELEHVGEDVRVRGTIRSDAWETWGGPVDGAPTHAVISATIRTNGTIVDWKQEGL